MISGKQIYTILTSGMAMSALAGRGNPGTKRDILCFPPIGQHALILWKQKYISQYPEGEMSAKRLVILVVPVLILLSGG
jgi:hypothetical protein